MGFFKTLFTGKEDTPEEKEQERQRNDFDMFKYDGIQAMRIGQTDFAIQCLQHALDIHDDLETRQHLANALLRRDDFDGAIHQLTHLVALDPENESFAISLAELYYQQEDYEHATEASDGAAAQFPHLPQPHHILAKIYRAEGKLIEAVGEATVAISLDANFDEAYQLRASILAEMGQYAEAEADADHVLAGNADADVALKIKAQCLQVGGHADEAEHIYRHLIDLNPFDTDAYRLLGLLLIQQGRKEEAANLAKEALASDPEAMEGMTGKFEN